MAESIAAQLGKIPLFSRLSESDLEAVARLFKRAEYPTGAEISRQGQIGTTAYYVESGELRVSQVDAQGVEAELGRLGPGAFFGETSLLLNEPRDASVEVSQDAVLWCITKDDFEQLLRERRSVLGSLRVRQEVARKRGARRFKWLDPDEIVVVCLHKHGQVLVRNLCVPVLVMLVGLLTAGYGIARAVHLAVIAGGILILVPLPFALYLYLNQINDLYIVTNKRVIHEERIPLIRDERAEAPLSAIQDIQQIQQGWSARLFNMGDLIIETEATKGHVVFRQISNPAQVRNIIFEQIQRFRARIRAEERAAIREALRRQFGQRQVAVPQPARPSPPKRERTRLSPPAWWLTVSRVFAFIPRLRDEQGDTITWRKHWIVLLKSTALPAILMAIATVVAIYLIHLNQHDWPAILVSYGIVMVFLVPWWFWQFADWQNDFYQVTPTRIIDVERLPFYLREDRREANLDSIQNIRLEIPSFLGKILRYGSVTIETSGVGVFTFEHVHNPYEVQKEIFRRIEAFQRRQRQTEAEQHRSELLDWFSVYDSMRRSQPAVIQPPSSPQES